MHARVHPLTPIDLYTEEVRFSLSNSEGTFFRTRQFPGDLYSMMTIEISYGRDITSLTAVWSGHYGKRWYLRQFQIR